MKKSILLFLFAIMASTAFSNDLNTTSKSSFNDHNIFTRLFQSYIKYPKWAKKEKIEATVWVSFDIDEDGVISNIEPITKHGYALEIEVVRVLSIINEQHAEKLSEAGINGHYRLPIKFELQ